MSQQSNTRLSAPLTGAAASSIAPSYTVICGVGTLVFPPFQILCSSPCPSGRSAIIPPGSCTTGHGLFCQGPKR